MTIVHIETVMWPAMKNEFSAMPVTMPGSAIGSTSRNETASRPKKLKRATPNAAIEPSRSATPVATSATRTESHERVAHVLRVPRDAEPVRREARDRPATARSTC